MIGHFLLTLTAEQEDRVLTTKMHPGSLIAPCLMGVAFNVGSLSGLLTRPWPRRHLHNPASLDGIGMRFDALCRRFGTPRVNAAIRNRILSNRARRELAQVQDEMYVGSML